ncbi:sialin-like [Diadema antillarum]|uniref:sialin-like n=1 Tax=Diadema antillarum TaxID=105358 RepID=UPI003A846381
MGLGRNPGDRPFRVERDGSGDGVMGRSQHDELAPLLPRKTVAGNRLCSTRYILSYMICLGFTMSYIARANMSVAITAMVNSSYSATYDNSFNFSSIETCPPRYDEDNITCVEGEFPWDAHTQELILSSFYYGFPVLQIPGGLLADAYPRSSPWVIGFGLVLSAICNFFVPLAARSGVTALVTIRIIPGLLESGSYPAVYSLLTRWSPRADRSKLLAIALSGVSSGQIIGPPISGVISQSEAAGGWPTAFYLCGSFGIAWFILWKLLVYESPMSHPRILNEEKDYILAELQLDKKIRSSKYPWMSILTSPPLLATVFADFAVNWVLFILSTNLPIFLTEVLQFNVSQAGFISSIPYILFFIFITGGGILADAIHSRAGISITATRKIMTTLGLLPSALFLILGVYVGCNAGLAISFLSLGLAFTGLSYSGAMITPMEFAAPYAGITVAIANTFAVCSGFIGPLVLGMYTENQADISGWRTFFWITAGLILPAWAFFMVYGSSEPQPWAILEVKQPDNQNDEKRHLLAATP